MGKYRSLLDDKTRPSLIPMFAIVQKDLTFINDGNDTFSDGLVNFEKLRMISKEIRNIAYYYSSSFVNLFLFLY